MEWNNIKIARKYCKGVGCELDKILSYLRSWYYLAILYIGIFFSGLENYWYTVYFVNL